jgi:hypothetical protein
MMFPSCCARSAKPNENLGIWSGKHQGDSGWLPGRQMVVLVARLVALTAPSMTSTALSRRPSLARWLVVWSVRSMVFTRTGCLDVAVRERTPLNVLNWMKVTAQD